ncbi:T9SS type A sorting domain-containing protein [Pontibacter locisalis]|uniref:T9SS type A sorting domain-containing protein n=1 Tax=Pontibacter locisalis TaxID=1719035 RepID=A0ABW5IJV0_9BACT
MRKIFTLLLFAAAFLLCPTLQAQDLSTSLQNPFFKAVLERNKKLLATESSRFATSQTIRVAQTETYSLWGENDQWDDKTRTSYTYNTNGLVETATVVELPANVNQAQYIYSYNNQGVATDLVLKQWNNNAWVNSMKITFAFEGEQLSSFGIYNWENGAWLLMQGTRSTHTRSGDRITETVSEFYSIVPPSVTQGWVLDEKITYGYANSSDNRPTNITTYARIGSNWVAQEKETDIAYVGSTYTRSSYFYEELDASTNVWNKYKIEYQHITDAANSTRTTIETNYNVEGTTLLPSLRFTTTELTSGEKYVLEPIVRSLQEVYDADANEWVTDSEEKATISRDSNGDITQIVYQELSPAENAWVNTERFVYTNFAPITITGASDEILALATEVYPNPVQKALTISVDATKVRNSSLYIYSSTGKKVYEQNNLKAATTVDVSNLPSGIYLVKLSDDRNSSITRRIVKQ